MVVQRESARLATHAPFRPRLQPWASWRSFCEHAPRFLDTPPHTWARARCGISARLGAVGVRGPGHGLPHRRGRPHPRRAGRRLPHPGWTGRALLAGTRLLARAGEPYGRIPTATSGPGALMARVLALPARAALPHV